MNLILPQLTSVRQLNISAIGSTNGAWTVTDLRLVRLAMSLLPEMKYVYARQVPNARGHVLEADCQVQLTKDPKSIGLHVYHVVISRTAGQG